MSFPPGFLDELRSRTSLARVIGRKVTWDQRKSNQGKGDLWAPCPFHQEKTASFHVDDRKGFYYCFGCQAKGDAISFVQETENTGFVEAVEILAREAGLQMPARDPVARQKTDRRAQLAEVTEAAAQFFRLQLKTGAGAAARDYLARRGLSEPTQERWEIGFAPDAWQGLWDHLRAKGVAEDLIFGAGLARPSSKGGRPYDIFRNRIIFPIRDARGRALGFGGRAMDPGDPAKYLNSPETDLFDKGRVLFNHGPARSAAGQGQPVIVAEGYMDVIALAEAGFAGAVAPLGTAITESQLQLLWRMTPEPLVALDGDKAGLGAAMRLMDLALPLIEAGNALRFALMPEGKDPDDLIRAEGPAAVQKVLDQALPMVRLLWQRETEGRVFDSPERKAALEKALRDKTGLIRDPSIRAHYDREIKDLSWRLFRADRPDNTTWRKAKARAGSPVPSARNSFLVASGDGGQDQLRESVILAILISAPALVTEFEAGLEGLECRDPDHRTLQTLLLHHPEDAGSLRDAIDAELGPRAVDRLLGAAHVAITPCLRRPGDIDMDLARMTLAEELAKLEARRGQEAEIAEAELDMAGQVDEAVTWRLGQVAEARNRSMRSQTEDRAEYDIGDNGARINREERNDFAALLARIRPRESGK
jgi:DNA primase